MKRITSLSLCALSLCSMLLLAGSMTAQTTSSQAGVLTSSQFNRAVHSDLSAPLRDMAAGQAVQVYGFRQASPTLNPKLLKQLQFNTLRPQATVGQNANAQLLAPVNATVGVNVLGVGVGFHGYTVPDAPTDVNMASGDWPGNQANAQVVHWVNVSYAVFRKSDGAYLAGPVLGNALWSGFPGRCTGSNSGDPIVQFDKLAHRWVMYQPVFSSPFAACFAVSTSPDFLGTWFRYEFPFTQGFPDYPKLGIMPDAYYQSNNVFNTALTAYLGAMPCAYNRVKMLAGDSTAEQICTLDNSNGTLFDDSFVPADLDSAELPPPAGTPEVYLGSIDNFGSETNLYEYTYKPNFTNGTAVLTGVNGSSPVATGMPAFVGLCNFGTTACVPQLGTTSRLQSLGDRLMYRLAFRRTVNRANVPINSWLISHSIANAGTGAMRWYEFRSPNSNITNLSIYQGGTYAPDATYRWMGSIAMDKQGNIALGYSRSSTALHPDIYFTGRAPADPLGTMQGELPIVDQTVATGSQRSTANRWGDYTSMSIDLDGCTFWYTNQYYTVPNSQFAWSTRLASLKFNSCTPTVLP
jgi:hypothetical protein